MVLNHSYLGQQLVHYWYAAVNPRLAPSNPQTIELGVWFRLVSLGWTSHMSLDDQSENYVGALKQAIENTDK